MRDVLIAAAVRLVLAQQGDVFNIGDRVAVDYHSDKSGGEWWLGTIQKGPAGKITVHFDNGDTESYTKAEGQTHEFVIIDARTARNPKSLKWSAVQKLVRKPAPAIPAAAPAKTTVKKPQATPNAPQIVKKPKPAEKPRERLYDLMAVWQHSDMKNSNAPFSFMPTEELYDQIPYMGLMFNNGRQGPTNTCVFIGWSNSPGNKLHGLTALCPQRDDLLWFSNVDGMPSYIGGLFEDSKLKAMIAKGRKVSYREFMNYRVRAAAKLGEHRTTHAEREDDKDENYTKLRDKLYQASQAPGSLYAKIKFANGVFHKKILNVDFNGRRVGIAGSGSKLRWIGLNYVLDINEQGW